MLPDAPAPPIPTGSTHRGRRQAALVIGLLALGGALMSWFASGQLVQPDVVDQNSLKAWDVWFDGDLPDYFGVAINRHSLAQRRAERHPLIGYATTVPALALQPLVRDPITRVRLLLAVVAALTMSVASVLLLAITGGARPTLVWGLLWIVSAQFVFWSGAIDTFLFGQLSLLLPLLVLRLRPRLGRGYEAALTLASAGSLGITATNWMAGLTVAGLSLPPRRAVQVSANALCLVLLLFGLLPFVCPGAEGVSMFQHRHTLDLQGNLKYLNRERIETPYHVTIAGIIAPRVEVARPSTAPEHPKAILHFRARSVLQNGPLFFLTVAVWLPLLALGLAGLVRGSFDPTFRLSLTALLAGQLVLHLLYGTYQFLYVAHHGPLVVLVAAHASRWWPRLTLPLAGVLVPLALVRNLTEFQACAQRLHQLIAG